MVPIISSLLLLFCCHVQSLQTPLSSSSPVYVEKKVVEKVAKFASLSGAILYGFTGGKVANSDATVFFDRAVYGDKELKIAVVNKIKQNLRNRILQDYSLAPEFLQLAINDALSYNAQSGEGGLDGSIEFELNSTENEGLERAAKVIMDVKATLKRTTQVTFGDLIAFAGAEALESVGCNRVTVQLGRYEVRTANLPSSGVPWSSPNVASIKEAFKRSGLTTKDAVLLLGGLGEINRVIQESRKSQVPNNEDDDDEPFEPEPFVPSTFGSRDEIYGKRIGKGDFGSKYFSYLLKGNAANDPVGEALLADPDLKALVQKYAGNEAAFKSDIVDSYSKLNLLGEAYTNLNAR